MDFGSQQRTGLPTKFDQFRQNIELTAIQKLDIISSHIHLRQNNLAPLNYVIDSFLTGSYKKNTMIRPPSDVDIFIPKYWLIMVTTRLPQILDVR